MNMEMFVFVFAACVSLCLLLYMMHTGGSWEDSFSTVEKAVIPLLFVLFSGFVWWMAKAYAGTGIASLTLVLGSLFPAVLLLGLYWLHRLEQKEKDLELMRMQRSLTEQKYQELQEVYEQNAKKFHHARQKVSVLYGLLQEGNTEEAQEILKSLGAEESSGKITFPLKETESVLRLFEDKMKSSNVKFEFTSDVSRAPAVKDGDLSILTANLLENALEAALKSNAENPFVSFSVKKQRSFLIVKCVNSSLPVLKKEGYPDSTKYDSSTHGYGFAIMDEIVNRYEGSLQWEYGEGLFTVKAMLTEKCG